MTQILDKAPPQWIKYFSTLALRVPQQLARELQRFSQQLIQEGNEERHIKELIKKEIASHSHARTNYSSTRSTFKASTNFANSKPVRNPDAWKKPNSDGKTRNQDYGPPYPYPKDDRTKTTRGKTPAENGGRPCGWCGSSQHYDFDCKHAPTPARTRVHMADADLQEAITEYLENGGELEIEEPPESDTEDEQGNEL